MKQHVFEARYGAEWDAFEAWLARRESGTKEGPPPIPDVEIPQRYRRLCHQLAIARDRRYATDIVDRLHDIAIEVHQVLYGGRTRHDHAWLGYILGGFARCVRSQRRLALAAILLFFVPFALMVALAQVYPDAVYYVMPGHNLAEFEQMYGPGASRLGRRGAESDFYMFGYYIFNNVSIAFQTFAGGLVFALGTVVVLVINGVMIGAVAGHVTAIGYGPAFWSFVAGHSAFELGGIVLSGAAGLRLGSALVSPGQLTRKEALAVAGRDAAGIMYGVAGMIVAAAFIEAFWSANTDIAHAIKYGVGIALVAITIGYFISAGRARAA
ncbi:MAG TPA: stage II sporulation protein M [Burkholderiales bacterium]|nr:stage II sporulation protein M [Burkholderiales bacterium]